MRFGEIRLVQTTPNKYIFLEYFVFPNCNLAFIQNRDLLNLAGAGFPGTQQPEEDMMSVSGVGPVAHAAPMPEKMEGPGPDHDGDSDDAAVTSSVQAQPQLGKGMNVDETA